MNNSKNKVQLVGHLGAVPEMKTFESGTVKAKMRICTNEHFLNAKGEHSEDVQWHTVVAWAKMAEYAAKTLTKGSEVSVEGRLNHRDYIAPDGQKRYYTEVVATEISLVEKKEPATEPQ